MKYNENIWFIRGKESKTALFIKDKGELKGENLVEIELRGTRWIVRRSEIETVQDRLARFKTEAAVWMAEIKNLFRPEMTKKALSELQALKDSKFVDEDGKIHDWEEYNGYHKTYSDRAKVAAIARWSDKKKEKEQKKEVREVQGNKKQESGDKQCLAHACSIFTDSPEFQSAWVNWISHLKEKRKPPTSHAVRLQLSRLEQMGLSRALAAVNNSIAKNYQGIFEENYGNNSSNNFGRDAKPVTPVRGSTAVGGF